MSTLSTYLNLPLLNNCLKNRQIHQHELDPSTLTIIKNKCNTLRMPKVSPRDPCQNTQGKRYPVALYVLHDDYHHSTAIL
jgi:hypothetical protein